MIVIEPPSRFLDWSAFSVKVQTHAVTLYEWQRGGGDVVAVPAAAVNSTLARLADGTAPAPALGDVAAEPEPYSRVNGSVPVAPRARVFVRTSDLARPVDFAAPALRRLAAAAAEARRQAAAGATLGAAAAQGGAVAGKLVAIKRVAPWLTWQCGGGDAAVVAVAGGGGGMNGSAARGRSAYRLVVAEMWCRTPKGRAHAACRRPTSTVAYREYS